MYILLSLTHELLLLGGVVLCRDLRVPAPGSASAFIGFPFLWKDYAQICWGLKSLDAVLVRYGSKNAADGGRSVSFHGHISSPNRSGGYFFGA